MADQDVQSLDRREDTNHPAYAVIAGTEEVLHVRPPFERAPGSTASVSRSSTPTLKSVPNVLQQQPRVEIAIPRAYVPERIAAGIEELATNAVRGNVYMVDDEAQDIPRSQPPTFVWVVGFVHDPQLAPGAFKITCSHDDFAKLEAASQFQIQITYNRPIEAYRALGHVFGISRSLFKFRHPERPTSRANTSSPAPRGDKVDSAVRWTGRVGPELRREEKCLFDSVGVMIDCSRNGVLRVSAVKDMLRSYALMGISFIQLYCEDTYEVEGEPFFGYFRGPYSELELKEIDDYADALGIEVIACIQTLGHLGQLLQWPKYGALRDTAEVLLAENAETYALIEKMIASVTRPLRSKRIHIGMDETYGVSEGRYRQIFGYKDSTKVFVEHLNRVVDICRRANLQPMMWSDMLFCLPAKNNSLGGYYDANSVVTTELSDSIPDEVETVFWDYYHVDSRPYAAKIGQHWQLANKAPWMASGIWTWSRFWTALPFTFATVKANMMACKADDSGVRNVMTTIWGDEGNECDLYSSMPGVLYQAEHAYTSANEVDAALLRRKFDGIMGADFDDYVYASKLDDTQPESQPIDIRTHYTPNLAKFLLWEQPFYSILSPQYRGYDLETHFTHLAAYLEQALSADFSVMNTVGMPHSIDDFPANSRLRLPYLLARVLALKCHLRERLVHAYRTDDRPELYALAGAEPESRLSRLRGLVRELHSLHRKHWMSMYKPFGWEVLDLRYGGLKSQLETMHMRIVAYLDDTDTEVTDLEELEVNLQTIYPGQGANLMLDHARASRPQYI